MLFRDHLNAQVAKRSVKSLRPEDYGARGDGISDDTQSFQTAIDRASGKLAVILADKTYRVRGDVLRIPPAGLKMHGHAQLRTTILSANNNVYIIKGYGARDVDISNIHFETSDGTSVAVGMEGACSEIRISNCSTANCTLYHGTTSAANYADASEANSPRNVQIENCVGKGNAKAIAGLAFISLHYHSNVKIAGCRAEYYTHGIMWWGGDSAANVNGAALARRKANDITISNCQFSNLGAGGIWGSMGRNIQVIDCKVDSCGDVGFDAEGCHDVTFRGGKVRNCKNGCLATFWGARNIAFQDVEVEMSWPNAVAFRSYNATLQASFAESVRIIGGSFTCLGGIGRVDQNNGPLDLFQMRGTRLRNVIVDMTQQNIHDVVIEDVSLQLTRQIPAGTAKAAICIGNLQQDGRSGGTGIVRNCEVASSVPQSGSADCGVTFIGNDVNADSLFIAEGNRIEGFETAIAVADYAGKARYRIRGNRLGRGSINKTGLSNRSVIDIRQ